MKSDRMYIEHIREALVDIRRFVSGMSVEAFVSDRKTQYAVMQAFEIVGEASSRISRAFRQSHADVPWRRMTDFRNKLIHNYFGISAKQVWDTVEEDVPVLLKQVERMLEERDSS